MSYAVGNSIRVYVKGGEHKVSYRFYYGRKKGVVDIKRKAGKATKTIVDLLDESGLTKGTLFLSGVALRDEGEEATDEEFMEELEKRLRRKISLELMRI